jgi:hypothetical protein
LFKNGEISENEFSKNPSKKIFKNTRNNEEDFFVKLALVNKDKSLMMNLFSEYKIALNASKQGPQFLKVYGYSYDSIGSAYAYGI